MNRNVSPFYYLIQITFYVLIGLTFIVQGFGLKKPIHPLEYVILLVTVIVLLGFVLGIFGFVITCIVEDNSYNSDTLFKHNNFFIPMIFASLGEVLISMHLQEMVTIDVIILLSIIVCSIAFHVKKRRLYDE